MWIAHSKSKKHVHHRGAAFNHQGQASTAAGFT